MKSRVFYCIVCGNKIKSGSICSKKCYNEYREFERLTELKNMHSLELNGYCNSCGKSITLKKDSSNNILYVHPSCSSFEPVSISLNLPNPKKKKSKTRPIARKLPKIIENLNNRYEERSSVYKQKLRLIYFGNKADSEVVKEKEKLIICPNCHNFSVEYIFDENKFYCKICQKDPYNCDLFNIHLAFNDIEKYKVYKLWGILALAKITGQHIRLIENFVGRYFEKCCLSKEDNCLYYNQFEDVRWKKQIEAIETSFEFEKNVYTNLFQNINDFSSTFEIKTVFLSEDDQIEMTKELDFFYETVEQLLSQFENYIIALAIEDLDKNQKAFVKEEEERLVATLNFNDAIEGFAWNKAKKGEMVGIFPFSLKFVHELTTLYYEFVTKVNNIPALTTLPSLERDALKLIASKKEIFQNQLWKQLGIDSRKCSRIVCSLLEKKLIIRESAVSKGSRTYLIKLGANYYE